MAILKQKFFFRYRYKLMLCFKYLFKLERQPEFFFIFCAERHTDETCKATSNCLASPLYERGVSTQSLRAPCASPVLPSRGSRSHSPQKCLKATAELLISSGGFSSLARDESSDRKWSVRCSFNGSILTSLTWTVVIVCTNLPKWWI